jgi:hypothetical protein
MEGILNEELGDFSEEEGFVKAQGRKPRKILPFTRG